MLVNCSALNQDLAKILTLQEEIDILWLQTEQTGIASVVLREKLDQLNILQDKLLEANLENFSGLYPDFAEQFKIKVEYGAEIEGFGNKNINSTLQLDSNTVLVTGAGGETRLLSKQTDGAWQYGAKISGFSDRIYSTLQLDPNTVLVTGAGGATCLLKITKPDITLDMLKGYLKSGAKK